MTFFKQNTPASDESGRLRTNAASSGGIFKLFLKFLLENRRVSRRTPVPRSTEEGSYSAGGNSRDNMFPLITAVQLKSSARMVFSWP